MKDGRELARQQADTETDDDDIRKITEEAWKPGIDQDGHAEEDTHVAEITGLMSGPGTGRTGSLDHPAGEAVPPPPEEPHRYEKETGWKYSIIYTNIPAEGIEGVPGSRHPQFTDVLHRHHAVVEDGVRGKAAGLRREPPGPGR